MDIRQFFLLQHARLHTTAISGGGMSSQDNMLRDTTDEQIRTRPGADFNSLAWLLWHMTRGEDISVSIIIAQQPQILDSGNWSNQLGISRRDLGTAMTHAEVDDLTSSINTKALLEYRAEVGIRTRKLVVQMTDNDFDQPITEVMLEVARDQGAFGSGAEFIPTIWAGNTKAFTLIHSVILHGYQHLGQGDTIRKLLGLATV